MAPSVGFSQQAGTSLPARQYLIQGRVFLDKNHNGTRESGEPFIRDIRVSNGQDVVHTDRKGRYSIMASTGQHIFPILPDGYTLASGYSGIPNASFRSLPSGNMQGDTIRRDFPLKKNKQTNTFSFGAIGDIQVGDSTELGYAARSLFTELSNRTDIAFHLILGDLINDDTRLYPALGQLIGSLPVPSWTLPGNHDRNMQDLTRPMDAYHQHFGASDYAFQYGPAFFMVFNNVKSTLKYGYEGRFDTTQLEFIKNCLKTIPKDQLIILSQHIPMGYTKNREEVLQLFEEYEQVLILSGHTHQVSRHFYGDGRIQELVTGAPSGTWWTGEKDLDGVPLALMQCGSPRNYFIVDVGQQGYRIRFKGIGLDEQEQMHLTLQDTLLTANVFAGSDSTRVRIQINDGPWHSMSKAATVAPRVAAIIEKNKSNIFPTAGNRILPLRGRVSPHVWQWKDSSLAEQQGLLRVRIHAADNHGFSVRQEHWFFTP